MKIKALFFVMMLFGALLFASSCFAEDWYVYCAGNKVIVDSRNQAKLAHEVPAYKNNIKLINKFSSRKDAETRAKHAGGIGAQCK
jgi:hypothetical protein